MNEMVDASVVGVSRARLAAALVAVTIVSLGLAAWLGSAAPVGDVRPIVLLACHILTPAMAAVACFLRADRVLTKSDRVAWTLLAVSAAVWCADNVIFGWYQLRPGTPTYPSRADGLYIVFALLALGALATFAWAAPHPVSRARTLLDGLVIASSLGFVGWGTVLGPLYHSSQVDMLAWISSLAYPVVDVTIASLVLALALRQVSSRVSFTLVGMGLLLIAGCDIVYIHVSLNGQYVVAQGFWQAGYTAGFLLVAVGALAFVPSAPVSADGVDGIDRADAAASRFGLWSQFIPYAPLALAVIVVAAVPLGWGADGVLLGLAAATLLFAVMREILVLAEAVALRADLERVVDARTAALIGSQARLRAITQTNSDAVVVVDATGLVCAWNSGATRLFGHSESEVMGREMTEFIPAMFPDGHEVRVSELSVLHADGRDVPVELSVTSWTHDGKKFHTGILRDISERRHTEEQFRFERAAAELLERIAVAANEAPGPQEALSDALSLVAEYLGWSLGHALLVEEGDLDAPLISANWYAPEDGRFDDFVAASESLTFARGVGLPGQVIESAAPIWLAPVADVADFPRARFAEAAGLKTFCGFPIRSRDTIVGVLEFFSTVELQPEPAVLELMDHIGTQLGRVIERDRSERRLTRMALHDPLTGLSNRMVFHEHLELFLGQAARRGCHVAVLLLDLDGFKEVNDSWGHATGDALLVEVARRLAASTRRGDSVARLGGDEFAIAMAEITGPEQAEAHAARILDGLMEPVMVQNRPLRVTCSLGIALNDPSTTAEDLLRNADLAMYNAKAAGKSRFAFFDAHMHRDVLNRLELEADLGLALDAGELQLLYQPIVTAATGEVRGREALVRWHHPERGLVMPDEFIPVAETSDLIVRIGAWVLERACIDAVGWQAAGDVDVTVSVNLSARELRPELIDVIREVLNRTGLPATGLVLELTESLVMEGSGAEAELLLALDELGVRLSVDDFGTGHSSLGRLRSLPVRELKIDRSFVTDLPEDPAAGAMVEAVIAMARALDREVVAEGVETPEQLAYLLSLGCHAVQGLLIGRPVPVEDCSATLISLEVLEGSVDATPSPSGASSNPC